MAAKSQPDELDIGALRLDTDNPRLHGDENLAMIAESLVETGAGRSIVIDEDNNVVVGSGTTEAAQGVGIQKVRVIEADGTELIAVRRRNLTPEQKAMMKLRDNRAAELAIWNADVLQGYAEQGLDLTKVFNDAELDAILAAAGDEVVLAPQETNAYHLENPMSAHPFANMDAPPADGSGDSPAEGDEGVVNLNGQAVKDRFETGIRPVQIFLTVKQHERFTAAVKRLARQGGMNTVTDVIFKTICDAGESIEASPADEAVQLSGTANLPTVE